jgi:hypothetical protein
VDLLAIVRIVLRRWYVSVPIVVATLVGAVVLQSNVPSQFRTSGSVWLVDPQFDPARLPDPEGLLDDAIAELQGTDALDEITIGDAEIAVGSIGEATVEAIATAESPEGAQQSVEAALIRLEEEVERLQSAEAREVDASLQTQVITPVITAEQLDDGRFRASGSVQIFDPTAGTANPYPAGGSTVRVLQVAATSDAGRMRVAERLGQPVGYTVTSEPHDAAPIMNVETSGPDPEVVLDGFIAVQQVIAEELDARQERAAVPVSRRLTVETLAQPEFVTDESPPLDRLVAMTAALGMMAAVGLTVAVESISRRRTTRRERASARARWGRPWRRSRPREGPDAPVPLWTDGPLAVHGSDDVAKDEGSEPQTARSGRPEGTYGGSRS